METDFINEEIEIPIKNIYLKGSLTVMPKATGIIIFAHGSGSGRFSPRNRQVADKLNEEGFATLLFDLLTAEEEKIDDQTTEYRFNIPLLAKRLVGVTDWVITQNRFNSYKIGYFGASTGAGAALIAAAEKPKEVTAVVSRGGRPDLAGSYLPNVKAPTLLIVGGLDFQVIKLNQMAQQQMNTVTQLEIVEGATHLFEEPGKLEEVIKLASKWFKKYLK